MRIACEDCLVSQRLRVWQSYFSEQLPNATARRLTEVAQSDRQVRQPTLDSANFGLIELMLTRCGSAKFGTGQSRLWAPVCLQTVDEGELNRSRLP
jgi:hypothetical protein